MGELKRNDPILTSCDREAIHLIGGIQPHGVLMVVDPSDLRICFCSDNLKPLLGREGKEALGQMLSEVLPKPLWQHVEKILGQLQSHLLASLEIPPLEHDEKIWEGLVYISDGRIGVELEASEAGLGQIVNTLVDDFISTLSGATDLESAGKILCRHIRALTGYERVMTYRFLPSWDGHVVAEDKIAEAHSFLDHRFPAGDIPLPARELYRRNRTRLIPDARATAVPLMAASGPAAMKPMDLSHSKLRAVSPIHLEYLKNMGVISSFSVAINAEDGLWGLVACHHSSPLRVPMSIRKACERSAAIFSMTTAMLSRQKVNGEKMRFEEGLRDLIHSLRLKADPQDALFREMKQVLDVFSCMGIALVGKKRVDFAGLTPLRTQLEELGTELMEIMSREGKQTYVTESLASLNPKWEAVKDVACGVLAVAVSDPVDSVLLFFRPEVLSEIKWGGEPLKLLSRRSYEGVINPRESFQTWIEAVRFTSVPWRMHEEEGALYLRDLLFESFVRKEHLIQELGRRVKT